jgi:spermidine/putrescine transport system ATP-binding protein
MSDRLVVMNAGRIEQLGSPREVYEHPRTRFVAGFIGTSNFIRRPVRAMDGDVAVLETAAEERIVVPAAGAVGARTGRPLDLTVRPEKISLGLTPPAGDRCVLRGRVDEVVYLGTSTQYAVRLGDGAFLTVFVQNAADGADLAARGADVWLSWMPEHSLALTDTTSEPLASGGIDEH